MDQEVLDARAKLAARFGQVQVGGKGKQGPSQIARKSLYFPAVKSRITAQSSPFLMFQFLIINLS